MKALHALDGNQVAELVKAHNTTPEEETSIVPLGCILDSMWGNFLQFSSAIDKVTHRR